MKGTYFCTCKRCHHTVKVNYNPLFYIAAKPYNKLRIILHAIMHHWALLPRKARLEAPYWLFVLTLGTMAGWVLDVLHAALWAVTWPVWWLHEEVL